MATLFGSYSKGIAGSLTVNFAPSGGVNCSKVCPFNKPGNPCYAQATEKRKPSITVNVERKADNQRQYLNDILANVDKLQKAPWIRFSAFGSVPPASRLSHGEREILRRLATSLNHSKVHLPIEDPRKAAFYAYLGFRPMLGMQDKSIRAVKAQLAKGRRVSVVANPDSFEPGWTKRAIEAGCKLARRYRELGYNAKVCPAVAGKAKCGDCRLCADGGADVVVYPRHK